MSTTPEFWRLDSDLATMVVVHDQAVPRMLWFGETLAPDLDINALLALDNSAVPFGTRDQFTAMSFFPQASEAYTASPGLSGHRAGAQFAHALSTINLHPISNVASVQTQLTNIADTPFTVDWLAAGSLPLPNHYAEVLSQHGRWGLENQTHRRPIELGRMDVTNLHGRTSHEHAPRGSR